MAREDVEVVRAAFVRFLRTGTIPWDLTHEDVETEDHDMMDNNRAQAPEAVGLAH